MFWLDDCLEPFFNVASTRLVLFFIRTIGFHVLLYHTMWMFKLLDLAQRIHVQTCKKLSNLKFQYLLSIECCPSIFGILSIFIKRIKESLYIFLFLMEIFLLYHFLRCKYVLNGCRDLLLLRCRDVSCYY